MRKYFLFSALFFSVVLSMNFKNCRSQTTSTPIELVNSISLTNISGRLGHMAYNNKQQVVYLAALSNNTMEIIDLQNKKTIRSIKSLRQPIDVEYIPNVDIVFVACLGDGLCRAFNANNFKEEISLRFDNNVSIVRFSPTFQMLYVGYGDGSIAVVDANTFKLKTTIKVPVHPEAIFLDENSSKMFVNLPKSREISVIDLKDNTVKKSFNLSDAAENYPIAYDKKNKRLFIGCRKPSTLLIVDSENGNKKSSIDIDGDVNEIFYDEARKQLYVTCGDGYLNIIKQEVKEVKELINQPTKQTSNPPKGKTSTKIQTKKTTSKQTPKQTAPKSKSTTSPPQYRTITKDTYETISRTYTGNGARTSLFIPELNQIIVAVPAFADKDAKLAIYQLK